MKPGTIISGDRQLSRERLFERAGRASSGFDALGVRAGDAVAIMLRNDFPFFEATFAAGRLGAHASWPCATLDATSSGMVSRISEAAHPTAT